MNINVSKITRRGIMVIAAAAALWPQGAGAFTKNWQGGSGSWSAALSWNPNGEPNAGDDARIVLNSLSVVTITYDYTEADITLNSLTLNGGSSTSGREVVFSMAANNLRANIENIGDAAVNDGGTAIFNQSGGNNEVNSFGVPGSFIVGVNSRDTGFYNLSGTGELFTLNDELIGGNGSGTFTQTGGENFWANIILGNAATATGTYSLQGGSAFGSGTEYIGKSGTGTFTLSGGTNSTLNLVLGNDAAAVGTYTQTDGGSGSNLDVAGEEDVGLNGTGTFTQDHGVHSISQSLYVGKNTGSNGSFNLTQFGHLQIGNLVNARLDEYVGYQGTGTFVQSGTSTNTATGLYLGGPGGNGSYLMNSRSANLRVNGDEIVGDSGVGGFSQLAGQQTVSGSLIVGNGAGVSGTFQLAGSGQPGDATLTAGSEIIGKSGTGDFSQRNGFNTIGGLILGNDASGVGTYTLDQTLAQPGTIRLTGDEYVGLAGQGTFNQVAGTQTITGNLYVANNAGSVGTYTLNQTAAAITLTGEEDIGVGGQGTFNHTAGQNNLGTLSIGRDSGGVGTYNLTGDGTLVFATGTESVGYGGHGTFNHTDGENTIEGDLYVGQNTGAVGAYNLSGSGFLYSGQDSASIQYIGYAGSGTLNQSGDSSRNIASNLSVGTGSGSGVYNLNGGLLEVHASVDGDGTETIGGTSGGSGTFVQTGGTNSIVITGSQGSGHFLVNAGTGSYQLTNGSLSVEGEEIVAGQFTQSGGSNSAGHLQLNGTYALSGGTLQPGDEIHLLFGASFLQTGGTVNGALELELNATYSLSGTGVINGGDSEIVGSEIGWGKFQQSGGINQTQSLSIGDEHFDDSNNVYALSGGTLGVAGDENIQGSSSFIQTGGVNTCLGNLFIGEPAESTNVLNVTITGGNSSIGQSVFVGSVQDGHTTLSVSGGGSLTIGGTLKVNDNPESGNIVNLADGGTITAGTLDLSGNPALLNWTGGTLDIRGPLDLNAGTFGQSLTLGGTQKLIVENGETVGDGGLFTLTINSGGEDDAYGQFILNANATLNLNGGGKFSAGEFIQSGGTVNGNYDNQQTYNYQSGIFNGRMINEGTLVFANTMTLANGLEQDGLDNSLDIFQGQTLTCNGQGLDNFGTIELEGGTLSGNGPVVNDFGGTLNATGTINPAFTNLGLLNVKGTLRLTGGAVNNGIINGNGTIIGSITNAAGGMIQPTSITQIEGEGQVITIKNPLAFTSFGGNNAGGTILLGAGLQLNISNAWTNDGLVTLQGTGASLGGNTITNTGTIQGAGTIGAKISNTTGSIRASGGELDLAGVGNTNAAGAQIQASTGNTVVVLTGLATNAGTIGLTGGAFDNNNKAMTNTGSIEGNGILRTGGLTNASGGVILLSDAATSVFGAVTNAAGGNIKIVSNTTTFFGPVTNNGTIKVTSGVARFLGNGVSMTVGGAYSSDPSDNYFNGLAITSTGAVTGGSGDRFFLTGGLDFTSAGTFNNTGALSAATVTNSGSFTQTGTLSETGNFINSGTAIIGGTQIWSPGTTFTNSASATFASDTGSASSSPLTLNDTAGSVTFGSGQHLAALTIATGASATDSVSSPRNVIVTGSLSVAGSLNLTNNDLIVHNGNLSAMTAELASAHGAGNTWWTGAGITSSSAATSPGTTALGVELNNDGHGNSLMTTFDGQTVTSTDVLVKYTFVGDADLSGTINATDYALIDNGFNIGSTGWRNGDFNYDNAINGDDYTLIDNAFNTQGGTSFAATSAGPAEMIAADTEQLASPAAVPEPTTLGLICMAAPLLSRRRRRLT